jgi:uncharacterized protein YyaL (SSP411 family)
MSIPALPKALTVGQLIDELAKYPKWSRLWIPDVNTHDFAVATAAFRITDGGLFGGDVVLEVRAEVRADQRAGVSLA